MDRPDHSGRLLQSEERFRRLAETVRLIPWEADFRTQQFTYVGPQAEAILGYPPAAWYAPGFWPAHIHPDDRAEALRFCHAASLARDDYEFGYRMVAANGGVVWIHDLVHVVRDDDPRLLDGFMVDVSDRRRVEEEGRRLQEQAIARSHGGVVRVWSSHGQGSTFTLLLPAAP